MLLNGEGLQDTATEETQLWTVSKSGANNLSVFVVGAVAVYVLANCTVAEFDALYAVGKAIRIQPSMGWTFNGDQFTNIKSVCYRTASSTSDIDFAAF